MPRSRRPICKVGQVSRLISLGMAENGQADADPPRARFLQAQLPKTLESASKCRSGSTRFGIGRRWCKGLILRSLQIPEKIFCVCTCELYQIVMKSC